MSTVRSAPRDQYAVIPSSLFLAYNQSFQHPQTNIQQQIDELQQKMDLITAENQQLIQHAEKLRNEYLKLAKSQQSILYLKCDAQKAEPKEQPKLPQAQAQISAPAQEPPKFTLPAIKVDEPKPKADDKSEVKPFNFGAKPEAVKPVEAPKVAFTFGAKPQEQPQVAEALKEAPKEAPKFTFGAKPEAKQEPPKVQLPAQKEELKEEKKPAFNFGAKPAEAKPEAKEAPKFTFGQEAPKEVKPEVKEAPKFSFGAKPEAPKEAPKAEVKAEPPKFTFGGAKQEPKEAPKEQPKFSFGKKQEEKKEVTLFGAAPEQKPAAQPVQIADKPKFSFGNKAAEGEAPKFNFGGEQKVRTFTEIKPAAQVAAPAPAAFKFNFSGAKQMEK